MAVQKQLTELSLSDFGDRLAERSATPGGGSVAAHLVCLGAALSAMAFRFTSGEKYLAVETEMARRVEELERTRRIALGLVDRDSASYDAVTAVYKLPKSTEAEKAARAQAVQEALRGALEVPLETMSAALVALRLCAAGASDINPNLASDCATGALCAWSAVESALLNVKINAASIHDMEYARQRLALAQDLQREAQALLDRVRTAIALKLG